MLADLEIDGTTRQVLMQAPKNGGLLSTAGHLVFQGTADGRLAAYTADSGEKLWELPINIGIVAPPITYSIDGQQYLAVLAGWGGGGMILDAGRAAASHYQNLGRLLVFRLGATAPVPPVSPKAEAFLPPTFGAELTETEERGQDIFHGRGCAVCHGLMAVSSGTIPDFRQLDETSHQHFDAVVRGGILRNQGMPSYADLLTEGDVAAIQVYLQRRTADDTAASQRSKAPGHHQPLRLRRGRPGAGGRQRRHRYEPMPPDIQPVRPGARRSHTPHLPSSLVEVR